MNQPSDNVTIIDQPNRKRRQGLCNSIMKGKLPLILAGVTGGYILCTMLPRQAGVLHPVCAPLSNLKKVRARRARLKVREQDMLKVQSVL